MRLFFCRYRTPRFHVVAADKKSAFATLCLLLLVLLFLCNSSLQGRGRAVRFARNVLDFFAVICKKLTDFQPFTSRNVEDITIFLWTRKNREIAWEIPITQSMEERSMSSWNKSLPTKLLFHGFSDNGKTSWIHRFKDCYLDVMDVNVMSVDWEALCRSPWYTTAAKNAKLVGREAARKLKDEGVALEHVHAIGSSLGAQAAAAFGYYCGGQINRLTGLDPSGPTFHGAHHSTRIDPSDAQFVDVIHTAGRWVGTDDAVGHVDFFPNSGRAPQPGCEGKESIDLTCSHLRAWEFFLETIKGGTFLALGCDSYREFQDGSCCVKARKDPTCRIARMGDKVNRTLNGKFYFSTRSRSPYSQKLKCDIRREI